MIGLNKNRKSFFINAMHLFLAIKGKINFLQLERFGVSDEQTYRNHFEKSFDYLNFNLELIKEHGGGEYTIGFDPCYINKSGKATPEVNWFWSGCAGTTKFQRNDINKDMSKRVFMSFVQKVEPWILFVRFIV